MIKGKFYLNWLEQELNKLEKMDKENPMLQLKMRHEIKECKKAIKMNKDFDSWEEIPTEDLWQDGELTSDDLMVKMFINVTQEGNWKLLRRKNNG